MSTVDLATSAKIKLDFPIKIDGRTINELTMRRPKVRDRLKATKVKGTEDDQNLAFMADLCEEPVEVLHELDEFDMDKVGAQYAAFTGRRPVTPEN